MADGIFAVAMTLLVLGLEIPDLPQETAAAALHETLALDWPKFQNYVLSFLLLAIFWINHHRQFHHVKRADEPFLWLNIFAFMLVAIVPFSTSLMSNYDGFLATELIFEANLLGLGLVYFAMWFYASGKYRLIDRADIDEARINFALRINLVVPVVSVMAMMLAFMTATWSETLYVACPFIIHFMKRRFNKNRRENKQISA